MRSSDHVWVNVAILGAICTLAFMIGVMVHQQNKPDTTHQSTAARLCFLTEPVTVEGNTYDPEEMGFYLPCRWMKLEQDV